ncbi:hypothetical protein FACS18942_01500 [Planctomycetales bacterium]|nr:hypothetical protein FACS18942_01500 [Planctomycetales bacterium]
MENQKDNWDVLALDLGLESEPVSEQEAEKSVSKNVPEIAAVPVVPPVAENTVIEKTAVTAEISAVAAEIVEEAVEEKTDENDFFGAGILVEPVKLHHKPQRRPNPVDIPKIDVPAKNEQKTANSAVVPMVQQENTPQEAAQDTPQREQKKSFLGRFAKMNIFGTPAKEQPAAPGKTQRHSGKAVTSFASKTVETVAVSLNRVAKPESPVQNVRDITADSTAEKKEPENAANSTPSNSKVSGGTTQKGTENNPWEQLVSQIDSRSEGLEHRRGQAGSDRQKYPRRPPSMFTDEPVESKESRALKNIIEVEEAREDAVERLNSIFNYPDSGRKEDFDEQSNRHSSPPRHKQREQRGQRGENRQENRRSDREERDYPQSNYLKRTGGKRSSNFNQRTDVDEQELRENGSGFHSWEEQEEVHREVKPAERLPRARTSRSSRTEYKQDFQERNSQERRREKRVISGHFNDEAEEFISDDEERIIPVDPALVQASKSALGWDDAISGIIDGNIRRHQSGGNYVHNNRQNRR